ncbi:hypothetical protein NMY22_g13802 [Coprinellus aureogranulatus]|nr:hypothetical protein NMY22_g13802 [Coprinellus aureogranulatus]
MHRREATQGPPEIDPSYYTDPHEEMNPPPTYEQATRSESDSDSQDDFDVPRDLEALSRSVEAELGAAILQFMTRAHSALLPENAADQAEGSGAKGRSSKLK